MEQNQDRRLSRMKELIGILSEAAKTYYQESREIMSNFQYDRMYDELLELEKETGVVMAGSCLWIKQRMLEHFRSGWAARKEFCPGSWTV